MSTFPESGRRIETRSRAASPSLQLHYCSVFRFFPWHFVMAFWKTV
jgi:hypothetical protein